LPHRGLAERIGGAGWALAQYLRDAFFPIGIGFLPAERPVDPTSLLFYAPILAVCALAGILWRRRASWGRPALFALGFHAVMVLPVLGLVDMAWLKIAPTANHLQYIPLMGPVALAGAGIAALAHSSPRLVAGASIALVTWLAGSTFQRSEAFRDDLTFWQEAARATPDSAFAHTQLAGVLLEAGRTADALPHFERAATVARDAAVSHRARSFWLLYSGQPAAAVAEADEAARLSPDPLFRRDLGVLLTIAGRGAEGARVLAPLVAEAPEDIDLRVWLARALNASDRRSEAVSVLVDGSRRWPGNPVLDAELRALLGGAHQVRQ